MFFGNMIKDHPIDGLPMTDNTTEAINLKYLLLKVENLKASIWEIIYGELFKDLEYENRTLIKNNETWKVEIYDNNQLVAEILEKEFYKYYNK